jgi:hypothetical protein
VWRVESQLGEEVQVDFMQGPMVVDTDGKRQRTWIQRMVLSFSPKGHCEAVLRHGVQLDRPEWRSGGSRRWSWDGESGAERV